jgi:hypothetical protein
LFKNLISTPMKTRTQILRKKTGESIPSLGTDAQQQDAASRRMLRAWQL